MGFLEAKYCAEGRTSSECLNRERRGFRRMGFEKSKEPKSPSKPVHRPTVVLHMQSKRLKIRHLFKFLTNLKATQIKERTRSTAQHLYTKFTVVESSKHGEGG